MAKYYFCSGFSQAFVTVTGSFGNCADYRASSDEYCSYQTWSTNITWTVSSANHPTLHVRWRYKQLYQQNGVTLYDSWVYMTTVIPAGVTHWTYEDAYGQAFDCRENRFCTFGGTTNPQFTPAQQV